MNDGTKGHAEDLSARIRTLWKEVAATVIIVLKADKAFGFENIEARIDPKIEDILHSLVVVEPMLTGLYDSGLLDHDEGRLVLNSKQCVWLIRMLHSALVSGDETEYQKAIALLDVQMKFLGD